MYICMCLFIHIYKDLCAERYMHACHYTDVEIKGSLVQLILFSHHVFPEDGTQGVCLSSKQLYALNCLAAGPQTKFFQMNSLINKCWWRCSTYAFFKDIFKLFSISDSFWSCASSWVISSYKRIRGRAHLLSGVD